MSGVCCIGELLWDVLPDRRTLGGAPANVAYHLNRLGVSARLVTRIGHDEAGEAALAQLEARRVDVAGVQRDPHLPTGAAHVLLDAQGHASYAFTTPAAWDALEPSSSAAADAVVFGTLAQRGARSRATIRALAGSARLAVCDLNLRAPYWDAEVIDESLRLATILKLNEDEVALLAGETTQGAGNVQAFASGLAARYELEAVCITRGAAGAGLWTESTWYERPAARVLVVDTVGAGDAFLAALLAARLEGRSWELALECATRLGGLVASLPGAMPEYDPAIAR
jgi:fructokinase